MSLCAGNWFEESQMGPLFPLWVRREALIWLIYCIMTSFGSIFEGQDKVFKDKISCVHTKSSIIIIITNEILSHLVSFLFSPLFFFFFDWSLSIRSQLHEFWGPTHLYLGLWVFLSLLTCHFLLLITSFTIIIEAWGWLHYPLPSLVPCTWNTNIFHIFCGASLCAHPNHLKLLSFTLSSIWTNWKFSLMC